MAHGNAHWPERFGFQIGGDSPCYIITVDDGSPAKQAGLQPGDQIVELDNQNVSNLSCDEITTIAKSSSTVPPNLVVVSCLRTIEIRRDKNGKFGFTVIGAGPVYVQIVEKNGAAEKGGVKVGDMVLEINGVAIHHSDAAKMFVKGANKLRLMVIPGAKQKAVKNKWNRKVTPMSVKDRNKRMTHFFQKVDEVLYGDPAKKDALLALLKQYARDKNVEHLAKTLTVLLNTPTQKQLLQEIRIFIPPSHRQKFDTAIASMNQQYRNEPANARELMPPISKKRVVHINRIGGVFGFTLTGQTPVYIESVDPGGAAMKAGLHPGDRILELNGIDVKEKTHHQLIDLLKGSGNMPALMVETLVRRKPKAANPPLMSSEIMSITSTDSMNEMYHASRILLNNDEYVQLNIKGISRQELVNEGRSLKEMLQHHLTANERMIIKKALQIYCDTRNLDALIIDIFPILDTPAKKGIWHYIIQLLPKEQQVHCWRKLMFLMDRQAAEMVFGGTRRRDLGGRYASLGHPEDGMHYDKSLFSNRAGRYDVTASRGDIIFKDDRDFVPVAIAAALLDLENREQVYSRRSLNYYEPPMLISNKRFDTVSDGRFDTITPSRPIPYEYDTSRKEVATFTGDEMMFPQQEHSTLNSNHRGESNSVVPPEPQLQGTGPRVTAVVRAQQHAMEQSNSLHTNTNVNNTAAATTTADDVSDGIQVVHTTNTHKDDFLVKLPVEPASSDNTTTTTGDDSCSSDTSSENDFEAVFTVNEPISNVDDRLDNLLRPSSSRMVELHTNSISEAGNDSECSNSNNNVSVMNVPVPPPVPSMPLHMGQTNDVNMQVKRINWEKLPDTQNTIWGQIYTDEEEDYNEVVRELSLEQQFSTKAKKTGADRKDIKKGQLSILDSKKTYNISILLAHMRMSFDEIKHALLSMETSKLSAAHFQQIIQFSPSETEVNKLQAVSKADRQYLSKADMFALELSTVPLFRVRLQALLFKDNFSEKSTETLSCLECLSRASKELRTSRKLAKILELVLAMGNYMNKGNRRVGNATGFKISFLMQLDTTKTTDNKSTFLHVLAKAVSDKVPAVLSFGEEIPNVGLAAKISDTVLMNDIKELTSTLEDISNTVKLSRDEKVGTSTEDKFYEVMDQLIDDSTQTLDEINHKKTSGMEEYIKTLEFFGESTETTSSDNFFKIFSDFVTKFERAHHDNVGRNHDK
ncbi:delphilin-like [Saccoglossus kowalevskii]|uniref:Delphilin-like n=1 Tax=Saccoglossus kowalevskii TaxID=10224 RepID=A0ABM0MAF9_SACKO|nr:PREDICTED: delphilin-like [Saccoglossus kowalevskii]